MPPPGRNAALALAGMLATGLLPACGGSGPASVTTESVAAETGAITERLVPSTSSDGAPSPPSAPAPSAAPAAAALATGGPALRRGSSGERVVALQRALASIGHDPGASDGDFGARTENAVKAFQAEAGLRDDGVVGARTIDAINERLVATRG